MIYVFRFFVNRSNKNLTRKEINVPFVFRNSKIQKMFGKLKSSDTYRLIPYKNDPKRNSGLPISVTIFLSVLFSGLVKESSSFRP